MKTSHLDKLFSILILLPFGASIAYLHFEKGVEMDLFIFGSGSWGFGCILKLALYHGIIRKLPHDEAHLLKASALNGLISGATELGLALAFFAFLRTLSFWEVIAFGLGIGTIEAALIATTPNLLQGTTLEKASTELETTVAQLTGGRQIVYGYLFPFAERLIATVIHVGTRGLVYVAYRSANPLPFIAAMTTFLFADGLVGYRLTFQGRLTDFRVLHRTYFFLAALGGFALACFLGFWPEGGYPPPGPAETVPGR